MEITHSTPWIQEKRLTTCFANASPPVLLAYLFGSAARGQATPFSDLDIAVYLDEPDRDRRVAEYRRLRVQLEDTLVIREKHPPIDLVFLNDVPSALAYRIITGKLLYCVDDTWRAELEARIISNYLDYFPVLQEYDRYLHRRIQTGVFGKRSPTLIDVQAVNDRLAYIQTTLQQLHARQSLSKETLETDPDKRGATLYEMQTCLEAMSDIAHHIIAATGLPKPRRRGESLIILANAGILPSDLADRLRQAVSMRNILMHGYLHVLMDLVYQSLQHDLPDIEAFAGYVVAYLRTLPDDA
ncbi:MAG: HepT-like ribonuclease domain-containing protein [Anaerolineales bacterium]